eukprot:550968-Rhodomonas_salina.1
MALKDQKGKIRLRYAMHLCARYALPGTDVAYGATPQPQGRDGQRGDPPHRRTRRSRAGGDRGAVRG